MHALESIWLSKYVISSWHANEDGTIDVDGNVLVTDPNIKKLPVKFNEINGTFKCMSCKMLSSTEGFPNKAKRIEIENCALPTEWYFAALNDGITLEQFLSKNFALLESEYTEKGISLRDIVKTHFPSFTMEHRGIVTGSEFGF